MSILKSIDQTHPIRNTEEEKAAFRGWAISRAESFGYTAKTEQNEKHRNVVIGDPESAEVVFTAHYDTPRRSLTPNLILPLNKKLFWAYNIGISLILVAFALAASNGIRTLSGYGQNEKPGFLIWYLSYFVIFVGLFKFVLFGPKNRHNANDNTSGAAAVLDLAKSLAGDRRAAFILFDNEEKGKKGSKAYAKAHGELKESKLVVNMDCVGNGEHFIIGASKKAKTQDLYPLFESVWRDAPPFLCSVHDAGSIAMNSDQKSFQCGIGICACRDYKGIGLCTPRIHTKYDTVASYGNIQYLTDTLVRFVQRINSEAVAQVT